MNNLVLFWSIGIIFSSLFYIFCRKYFNINLKNSILYCVFFLLFEIIGAKLLFILENIDSFSVKYLSINSGFSLFGVFIFTPILIYILLLILRVNDKRNVFNFFIIGMFIELFFYRIGCITSGCCGGIKLSLFGTSFQFPTRIIEMLFCVGIVFTLLSIKDKYKNFIFPSAYISYGVFRFINEFFRIRTNVIGDLSISHFIAVLVVLIGLSLIAIDFGRNRMKNY